MGVGNGFSLPLPSLTPSSINDPISSLSVENPNDIDKQGAFLIEYDKQILCAGMSRDLSDATSLKLKFNGFPAKEGNLGQNVNPWL